MFQKDLNTQVPLFLMGIGQQIHEVTGNIPAEIIFGNELRLLGGLQLE